jgi:murein DD-endopeptidase MepM/ murein hydrolase activator NlpD
MRAIPVTRAVLAGAAAFLALGAVPSAALAERWLRPVPGALAHAFSYSRAAPFTAGAHRGLDLAAPPGTAVRAACGGRVIHAGPVAGGPAVVSVRCGGRRVSYLPMASVAVRAGSSVRAGVPIGTVASGHDGLHVGVRREGHPFGYEDPAALLAAAPRAVPVGSPRPRPRPAGRAPRADRPHPSPRGARRVPRPAAQPRPLPALPAPPRPLRAPRSPAAAPWVAWAGLALVVTGAAGSGTAITVRRRRSRRRAIARAASPA